MAIKTEEYHAQRKKDHMALRLANETEKKLIKAGYKWISNRTVKKLVHPKKVISYLSLGWKICKI